MRAMRQLALLAAFAGLTPAAVRADDAYRQAPAAVHEVLRAPAIPTISISPDARFAV